MKIEQNFLILVRLIHLEVVLTDKLPVPTFLPVLAQEVLLPTQFFLNETLIISINRKPNYLGRVC